LELQVVLYAALHVPNEAGRILAPPRRPPEDFATSLSKADADTDATPRRNKETCS
jgi:hypothetical protein